MRGLANVDHVDVRVIWMLLLALLGRIATESIVLVRAVILGPATIVQTIIMGFRALVVECRRRLLAKQKINAKSLIANPILKFEPKVK